MLSDEQIFHRAIWQNPQDAAHWNAYSDWLAEQGHHEAADGAARIAQNSHRLQVGLFGHIPVSYEVPAGIGHWGGNHFVINEKNLQALRRAFGTRFSGTTTAARKYDGLFPAHGTDTGFLAEAGLATQPHLVLGTTVPSMVDDTAQHRAFVSRVQRIPGLHLWNLRQAPAGLQGHPHALSTDNPRQLAEEAIHWLPEAKPQQMSRRAQLRQVIKNRRPVKATRGGADEQAFIKGIQANHYDQAPRLVYSDWLEEHGADDEANAHRHLAQLTQDRSSPWREAQRLHAQGKTPEAIHLLAAHFRVMGHHEIAEAMVHGHSLHPQAPYINYNSRWTGDGFNDPHAMDYTIPQVAPAFVGIYAPEGLRPVMQLSFDTESESGHLHGNSEFHWFLPIRQAQSVLQAIGHGFRDRANRWSQHNHPNREEMAEYFNNLAYNARQLREELGEQGLQRPEQMSRAVQLAEWPHGMVPFADDVAHPPVQPHYPTGMVPYAHPQSPLAPPPDLSTRDKLLAAFKKRRSAPVTQLAPPEKLARRGVKAPVRLAAPPRYNELPHLSDLLFRAPNFDPALHSEGDDPQYSDHRQVQAAPVNVHIQYHGSHSTGQPQFHVHVTNSGHPLNADPEWHRHYLVNHNEAANLWHELTAKSQPHPDRLQQLAPDEDKYHRSLLQASLGVPVTQGDDEIDFSDSSPGAWQYDKTNRKPPSKIGDATNNIRPPKLARNETGAIKMSNNPADHAPFLNAIRANPHDRAPALIYADYLDEIGRPQEALGLRFWAGMHDLPTAPIGLGIDPIHGGGPTYHAIKLVQAHRDLVALARWLHTTPEDLTSRYQMGRGGVWNDYFGSMRDPATGFSTHFPEPAIRTLDPFAIDDHLPSILHVLRLRGEHAQKMLDWHDQLIEHNQNLDRYATWEEGARQGNAQAMLAHPIIREIVTLLAQGKRPSGGKKLSDFTTSRKGVKEAKEIMAARIAKRSQPDAITAKSNRYGEMWQRKKKIIACRLAESFHRYEQPLYASSRGEVVYGRGGQDGHDPNAYSKSYNRQYGGARWKNAGARLDNEENPQWVIIENHRGSEVARLPFPKADEWELRDQAGPTGNKVEPLPFPKDPPKKLSRLLQQAIRLVKDTNAPPLSVGYPAEVAETKPQGCTCSYPQIKLRNGSGHGKDLEGKPCPCHKEWLKKNVWGKKKGETKHRRDIDRLHNEWGIQDEDDESGSSQMRRSGKPARFTELATRDAVGDDHWKQMADYLEQHGLPAAATVVRSGKRISPEEYDRWRSRQFLNGAEVIRAALGGHAKVQGRHYTQGNLQGEFLHFPAQGHGLFRLGAWLQSIGQPSAHTPPDEDFPWAVTQTSHEYAEPQAPVAFHVTDPHLAHAAAQEIKTTADLHQKQLAAQDGPEALPWTPPKKALLQRSGKPVRCATPEEMQALFKGISYDPKDRGRLLIAADGFEEAGFAHAAELARKIGSAPADFWGTDAWQYPKYDPEKHLSSNGWINNMSRHVASSHRLTGIINGVGVTVQPYEEREGMEPWTHAIVQFHDGPMAAVPMHSIGGLLDELQPPPLPAGTPIENGWHAWYERNATLKDMMAQLAATYATRQASVPEQMSRRTRLRQAIQMAALRDRPISVAGAQSRIGSSNHYTMIQTLQEVLNRSGLRPNKVYPAIHDVSGAARAAAVAEVLKENTAVSGPYGTAWQGLIAKLPNLVLFRSHPKGVDSVYRVGFKGPQVAFAQLLDKAGIASRTFVPHNEGSMALIYDRGRSKRDSLGQLAAQLGLQIVEHTGYGEPHGGGDDMGRASYRDTINATEQGAVGGSQQPVQQRRSGRPVKNIEPREVEQISQGMGSAPLDRAPVGIIADALEEQGHKHWPHLLRQVAQHGVPDRWNSGLLYDPENLYGLHGTTSHSWLTGHVHGLPVAYIPVRPDGLYDGPHTHALVQFGDSHRHQAMVPLHESVGLLEELAPKKSAQILDNDNLKAHFLDMAAHGDQPEQMQRGGRSARFSRADADVLLKAIYANPDDQAPRLALADWLHEQGAPHAAGIVQHGEKIDWWNHPAIDGAEHITTGEGAVGVHPAHPHLWLYYRPLQRWTGEPVGHHMGVYYRGRNDSYEHLGNTTHLDAMAAREFLDEMVPGPIPPEDDILYGPAYFGNGHEQAKADLNRQLGAKPETPEQMRRGIDSPGYDGRRPVRNAEESMAKWTPNANDYDAWLKPIVRGHLKSKGYNPDTVFGFKEWEKAPLFKEMARFFPKDVGMDRAATHFEELDNPSHALYQHPGLQEDFHTAFWETFAKRWRSRLNPDAKVPPISPMERARKKQNLTAYRRRVRDQVTDPAKVIQEHVTANPGVSLRNLGQKTLLEAGKQRQVIDQMIKDRLIQVFRTRRAHPQENGGVFHSHVISLYPPDVQVEGSPLEALPNPRDKQPKRQFIDDPATHPTTVQSHIAKKPGIGFADLKKATNLPSPQRAAALNALLSQKLIIAIRKARQGSVPSKTVFFPADHQGPLPEGEPVERLDRAGRRIRHTRHRAEEQDFQRAIHAAPHDAAVQQQLQALHGNNPAQLGRDGGPVRLSNPEVTKQLWQHADENPHDAAPWLITADALEEQGLPHAAHIMRLIGHGHAVTPSHWTYRIHDPEGHLADWFTEGDGFVVPRHLFIGEAVHGDVGGLRVIAAPYFSRLQPPEERGHVPLGYPQGWPRRHGLVFFGAGGSNYASLPLPQLQGLLHEMTPLGGVDSHMDRRRRQLLGEIAQSSPSTAEQMRRPRRPVRNAEIRDASFHEPWVNAIGGAPFRDVAPKLIYADALEEQDDTRHQLIRDSLTMPRGSVVEKHLVPEVRRPDGSTFAITSAFPSLDERIRANGGYAGRVGSAEERWGTLAHVQWVPPQKTTRYSGLMDDGPHHVSFGVTMPFEKVWDYLDKFEPEVRDHFRHHLAEDGYITPPAAPQPEKMAKATWRTKPENIEPIAGNPYHGRGEDYYGATPTEEWLKDKHYRGTSDAKESDTGLGEGWTGVRSSWIAGIRRIKGTNTVDMFTKKGVGYRYNNVPKGLYRAWVGAGSKGRFWWGHIRDALSPATRLMRAIRMAKGLPVRCSTPETVAELHRALSDHPHDSARWGILADAVEEMGRPGIASLLRLLMNGANTAKKWGGSSDKKTYFAPGFSPSEVATLHPAHYMAAGGATTTLFSPGIRLLAAPVYPENGDSVHGGMFHIMGHHASANNGVIGWATVPLDQARHIMEDLSTTDVMQHGTEEYNENNLESHQRNMRHFPPEQASKLQRGTPVRLTASPEEIQQLHAAITADPGDNARWLIASDALEENGHSGLASLYRHIVSTTSGIQALGYRRHMGIAESGIEATPLPGQAMVRGEIAGIPIYMQPHHHNGMAPEYWRVNVGPHGVGFWPAQWIYTTTEMGQQLLSEMTKTHDPGSELLRQQYLAQGAPSKEPEQLQRGTPVRLMH